MNREQRRQMVIPPSLSYQCLTLPCKKKLGKKGKRTKMAREEKMDAVGPD